MADREPDLLSELMWLRKGPGLTRARLLDTMIVAQLLGGKGLPSEALIEQFRAVLGEFRGMPYGDALWAAYAPDTEEHTTLKQRQVAYGQRVGRKPDTLLDWEKKGVEALAARLRTPKVLIPRAKLLIKDLHIVCVNRDRRFVEHRQTRTVISQIDGKETFEYHTYSPTELSHVVGGVLEPSEPRGGGTVHRIRFPRPLGRTEQHTFSFRERVPASELESEVSSRVSQV